MVHARRWVVERLFAWINRNWRLAKDVEATLASAGAFLYAASAILLLRRLARCEADSSTRLALNWHMLFVDAFLIYFPFSKMTHAVGAFATNAVRSSE